MTVRMIKSIGDVPYPIDTHSDTFSPLLTAGAALGITGDGPTESAAWLQRVSTADGPTTIRSIHGNTIVQDGELLPVNMTGIETEDADGEPLQTRTIPAGTLRGAGTVYDELTETERITRVGEVVLSEISWTYDSENKRFSSPVISTIVQTIDTLHPLAKTARLDVLAAGATVGAVDGFTVASGKIWLSVEASQPTIATSEALNTWLAANCPTMHVALATPTTTPIDPPLNLTYRTASGGTERVMVPTGEQSAPPTIVTAQGYTAESLRDAALSAIAPVENGKASTNYGVGSYLVHGGQLCKVTTAIATGEAISIGTNVTATTVMAEVLSLTQ